MDPSFKIFTFKIFNLFYFISKMFKNWFVLL